MRFANNHIDGSLDGSLTKFLRCLQVFFLAAAALTTACNATGTTETTNGPFYTLTLSVADSTSFPAGTTVLVRATVTHEAAAVANVAVGWGVKKGDSTITLKTTLTDTLGQTSIVWTLADSARINTLIVAAVNDRADTLNVIGTVGKPVYILAVGADSVQTTVGTTVTLQARVTDRPGNSVVGAPVNWTTTGGPRSPATIPTGAGGISQIGFSYPTPGIYFVTAELPGQGTHIFKIVVQ